jgi:type VI protein secretion system component VasF
MPELRPHPYQHQRPRRPRDLARRLQPPPERRAPPDLRYLLYAGMLLAAVLAALATPYLVSYLLQALNGG